MLFVIVPPGTRCETEVNECNSPAYPCSNEGTDSNQGRYSGCDDLVNAYKCYCKPGYTGEASKLTSSTTCPSGRYNVKLERENFKTLAIILL